MEYAALMEEAYQSNAKIFFADEAHFRTDAELRGKWVLRREPAPWSRPTSCWRTSCPDSTPNSVCLLTRPRPPIAPWIPPCIWNGSSASSTCAKWLGTTPSSTNYAPCNCFQPKTDPAIDSVKVEVLEGSDGQLMVQYGGDDPPPGGAAQGRGSAGRPGGTGANPGTGPSGQEPEPARPHQKATPAIGGFGDTRRPTGRPTGG